MFKHRNLLFLIILFAIIFFPKDAFALDLPTPDRACIDGTDGTKCFTPLQGTYWDNSYFTTYGNGYLGNPSSTSPVNSSVNFQWDTVGLCTGKTILIEGDIAGIFNFFDNQYTIDVYNSGAELSCVFTRVDSSHIKYKCSGVGGGKFQINVNLGTVPLNSSYDIGVSKYVNVSCDSSTSDIITNQDKNAQDIMDNIDRNTQKIIVEENKVNDSINRQTETIKDSNVDEATGKAGSFFTDFEDNDYGLTDIVTLPLEFISSLSTSTCTDLVLPLPFVDENATLPCMSTIYETYFGDFLDIYQIITFGIVAYWVCVNTLRLVNNFKDPDNDEVEVLDL